MKKVKCISAGLIGAMSLASLQAPLYAKEILFLINGEQIQSTYHEDAKLSFQVEETEKEHVELYVMEEEYKQRITSITWQKNNEYWIGVVEVQDGEQLQYELKINEESYTTPVFSKDSQSCSMKLFEDQKEVGVLQDTYQKNTMIDVYFYDEHLKDVLVEIRKDGVLKEPQWIKPKEHVNVMLENGTYQIYIEMLDSFGNIATYEKTILVDDTLPEVEVVVNHEAYQQTVFDSDILVELYVNDLNFDVHQSNVFLDDQKLEITWEKTEKGQKATYVIQEEGQHRLHYVINDFAGNQIAQECVLDIDHSKPVVQLFEQMKPLEEIKDMYDHEVHLQFLIEEPHIAVEKSYFMLDGQRIALSENQMFYEMVMKDGVHDVSYHIEDSLGHVSEANYSHITVDTIAPLIQATVQPYYRENVQLPITMEDENLSEVYVSYTLNNQTKTLPIECIEGEKKLQTTYEFDEEGVYEVKVVAVDKAQNRTTQSFFFTIDKTAPVVHLPLEGGYYLDHPQSIRLEANELYLDRSSSYLKVYRNGELVDHCSFIGKDTFLQSYQKKDGTYELVWLIKDLAGNTTKGSREYVVDTQKPTLSLTTNQNYMSNQPHVIEYTINDATLRDYEVWIKDNGKLSVYKGNQNHKDRLQLASDGYHEYEIQLKARDLAGHDVSSEVYHLVYDPNAPTISAFINQQSIKENIAFVTNKNISLFLQIQDELFKQCHATLYRDQVILQQASGTQFSFDIFKEDGKKHVYQLLVEALDQSGNRAFKMFDFVIDCYVPTIQMEGISQDQIFSHSYIPKLNKEKDLQIVHYQLKKDGIVQPYQWFDPIEEEGKYELSVSLRDQAMNLWQGKEPLRFEIDRTPPNIQLYDQSMQSFAYEKVEKGSRLILFIDQANMEKRKQETFVKLRINGIDMDLNTAIRNEEGILYYPFLVEETMHLYVEAIDEAGNKQIYENHIQIASKKEVTKERKQQEALKQEALPIAKQEKKSDIVFWILSGIMMVLGGSIWYGIKKFRNHHPKS